MPIFSAKSLEKNRCQQRRLEINLPAHIRFPNGICYEGQIINISFNGAFFKIDQVSSFCEEQQCVLTILLSQDSELITIKFRSTVKRVANEGIGLEFDAIYPEDYNDFVYLMAGHIENPDELLAEIKVNPVFSCEDKFKIISLYERYNIYLAEEECW